MKITHCSALLIVLMAMSSLAMHIVAQEYIKPEFIKQQQQPFFEYVKNLENDIWWGKGVIKFPFGSKAIAAKTDNSRYTTSKDMQVLDKFLADKDYIINHFSDLSSQETIKDLNTVFGHLKKIKEQKGSLHKDNWIEELEKIDPSNANLTHEEILDKSLAQANNDSQRQFYMENTLFAVFVLYLHDESPKLNIDFVNSQFEIPTPTQKEQKFKSPTE